MRRRTRCGGQARARLALEMLLDLPIASGLERHHAYKSNLPHREPNAVRAQNRGRAREACRHDVWAWEGFKIVDTSPTRTGEQKVSVGQGGETQLSTGTSGHIVTARAGRQRACQDHEGGPSRVSSAASLLESLMRVEYSVPCLGRSRSHRLARRTRGMRSVDRLIACCADYLWEIQWYI